MFSWKKQNPPSKQRQQQAQGGGEYSDLIAQGMRLANEDIDESGADTGDYMGDEGDEDLGDMDLDDPELLAELQGLTGEAPAPRPKPAAGLTKPPPKPAQVPAPVAPAPRSVPATKPSPVPAKSQPLVQPPSQATPPPPASSPAANPALAGLGLDLDGAMEDDDDEEVELTEDDWNDPHFMAQLQSLGGHAGGHQDKETLGKSTTAPVKTEVPAPKTTTIPTESGPLVASNNSFNITPSLPDRKLASASSSMIAIPPQDKAYNDEDMDGDSLMTDHTDDSKVQPEQHKPSSPTEVKSPKRVETIPKTNHKDLLKLLKTRETQYKRAALDAKKAGNMALAKDRMKVYKSLQGWIQLVEAGGFLDLEIYPIPEEPPAAAPLAAVSGSAAQVSAASSPQIATNTSTPKPYFPPLSTPAAEPTTQVSSGIAEASGEDMRAGPGRALAGIQFSQLRADDDFQIVSNSDADTYDMLESQLESQIKMCDSTLKYYFEAGDKNTALKFHKLNKNFKADLVSLQSHRSHGKKAPAFHFQDVRYEQEHGFYEEIGLNDLSLSIMRAWDLSHKDVQPADIDSYVMWDLGWPTESMAGAGSGKGTTPSIKKTAKPDYNYSKTLGIERTRAFNRFVERRKATFEVWHYRGLLWKDYLIGRGQIALQPLLEHSEIHEIIPLLDPTNRRNTGGKIEVKIRLQRPLLKPEIIVKEEKWVVIDEFNSAGLGFPSTVAATPSSRSSGSPAIGRTGPPAGKATKAVPAAPVAATPTPANATRAVGIPSPAAPAVAAASTASVKQSPKPPSASTAAAGQRSAPASRGATPAAASPKPNAATDAEEEESESDKALNELNSIELLVSNMVLESEIQIAQSMIHDARAVGNAEAAEEYQDRLMQLEIKMKLLVLQVQTGQLTMDVYCQSVYGRIGKDKKLAVELKRLGMVPEAKRALGRSKIMTQEMKEVEEAMAAQGEEDEE
ncbi:Coiled-coil and C2 domain-containing protein 1B [Mortierella hygrophila]|uniref:Coiled-coil and C2 domain-containing protein 1B n=1 Tax=Mortierella hygrophila TaxID=979708 RepID=A0A9P6F4Z9_9FUNG|nr:Coiled-coil and C2 domain-containing protein 1B [Mortierella hygrophila]